MSSPEANKALVREHMRVMIGEGKWEQAIKTYVDENMIQHSPSLKDGAKALQELMDREMAGKDPASASYEMKQIFAEGDLVAMFGHFRFTPEDRGIAVFDMFRVKDGKFVEHWDVIQPVPEKSENNNSMF